MAVYKKTHGERLDIVESGVDEMKAGQQKMHNQLDKMIELLNILVKNTTVEQAEPETNNDQTSPEHGNSETNLSQFDDFLDVELHAIDDLLVENYESNMEPSDKFVEYDDILYDIHQLFDEMSDKDGYKSFKGKDIYKLFDEPFEDEVGSLAHHLISAEAYTVLVEDFDSFVKRFSGSIFNVLNNGKDKSQVVLMLSNKSLRLKLIECNGSLRIEKQVKQTCEGLISYVFDRGNDKIIIGGMGFNRSVAHWYVNKMDKRESMVWDHSVEMLVDMFTISIGENLLGEVKLTSYVDENVYRIEELKLFMLQSDYYLINRIVRWLMEEVRQLLAHLTLEHAILMARRQEEIKFEPTVRCEGVDRRATFLHCQLEYGDITCFHEHPPAELGERIRFSDVPSEYVKNCQIVHFRALEKPKEDEFCFEVAKNYTYDDVVEKLAQRLGLDSPSEVQLTPYNCYLQQPKRSLIKYRSFDHLSDMLYNQVSNILYFEVLDFPLPELQCLETLKVAFHHATKDDAVTINIRLPKQATYGDVLDEIKNKAELSYPNAEIILLEVFYHKIYKIFPIQVKINSINDQYWTLLAEMIPEEEKNRGPNNRLIRGYHFTKENAQNQVQVQKFGEPFFLVIDEDESLLFSRGETRKDATPRSEAQSYWIIAGAKGWFRKQYSVRKRALTEELARYCFENLLFSLCRFPELTGTFPENITIVGYNIKEVRSVHLHRSATVEMFILGALIIYFLESGDMIIQNFMRLHAINLLSKKRDRNDMSKNEKDEQWRLGFILILLSRILNKLQVSLMQSTLKNNVLWVLIGYWMIKLGVVMCNIGDETTSLFGRILEQPSTVSVLDILEDRVLRTSLSEGGSNVTIRPSFSNVWLEFWLSKEERRNTLFQSCAVQIIMLEPLDQMPRVLTWIATRQKPFQPEILFIPLSFYGSFCCF